MKCIFCNSPENKVVDSRNHETNNAIRRRRECLKCGKRFTSYETVESLPFMIQKSTGGVEAFNSDKLKQGIVKACEKRPIHDEQINHIVSVVERTISAMNEQDVTSRKIAEIVLRELKSVDTMAHLRYAIVHERFNDVSTMLSFIKTLEVG